MQQPASDGPPPSVITVAAVQFLGSLPFLYVCGIALWGVGKESDTWSRDFSCLRVCPFLDCSPSARCASLAIGSATRFSPDWKDPACDFDTCKHLVVDFAQPRCRALSVSSGLIEVARLLLTGALSQVSTRKLFWLPVDESYGDFRQLSSGVETRAHLKVSSVKLGPNFSAGEQDTRP